MKTINQLIMISLLSMISVGAGAAVDDFQSLISESIQAKKELTEKLKKSVGHDDAGLSQRHQRIVIKDPETQIENIVVPSRGVLTRDGRRSQAAQMEKDQMNRLSQELEDAK
jgi:hypothetical protein